MKERKKKDRKEERKKNKGMKGDASHFGPGLHP